MACVSDLLRLGWSCPVWQPGGGWSLCSDREHGRCRRSHQRTTSHRALLHPSGSATGFLSSRTSDTSSRWWQETVTLVNVFFFNPAVMQRLTEVSKNCILLRLDWIYKTNSKGQSKQLSVDLIKQMENKIETLTYQTIAIFHRKKMQ